MWDSVPFPIQLRTVSSELFVSTAKGNHNVFVMPPSANEYPPISPLLDEPFYQRKKKSRNEILASVWDRWFERLLIGSMIHV